MLQRSRTVALLCLSLAGASAHAEGHGKVTAWLTTPDRTSLLSEQPKTLHFTQTAAGADHRPSITVDDKTTYQSVDGFGFALTGGSAGLIMRMDPAHRKALLRELFRSDGQNIGVSYLRVSIGASDMNDHVFTYDDQPAGKPDPSLSSFSIAPDKADVIPVLRQILAINPHIRILASPWTAPFWMKTREAAKGGSLRPEYYDVYAHYLVKYLLAMQAEGIRIDALTMQNEPLNNQNTPSMEMHADEQTLFLKGSLGPLLRNRALATKVILYDHNCDLPDYPMSILADPDAAQYAYGSGFHLYRGDISALSTVHTAFPAKNIYFTEQMIIDRPGAKDLAIARPEQRVVIGALANWSRNVLLWNLAADPKFGPHTSDGGCPMCEGAITLDGNTITRNLAYYTVAHASKFIPPGSVRISSVSSGEAVSAAAVAPVPQTLPAQLPVEKEPLAHVAFRTAGDHFSLIVVNSAAAAQSFDIHFQGESVTETLPPGAVATYLW